MQCMKCGRDLESGEVFCRECQEVMDKYPVKPGTVVQLPHRPEYNAVKKQVVRRKVVPLEEQVQLLKKLSRRLGTALIVTILIAAVAGYVAVTQFIENRSKQVIGQNYSVVSTEAPTTDVTEVTTESTTEPTTEATTEPVSG